MIKPKILFVTDTLANGGAERQLELLIRQLSPKWEIKVFSLDGGSFSSVLKKQEIEVVIHRRRCRFDITRAFNLWWEIKKWQPKLVHCWGWMGQAAALPLCSMIGIPTIGTVRTGKIRIESGWFRGYISSFVVRLSTCVIVNSKSGLTAWRIPYNIGRIVYNGFDKDRFQRRNRLKGKLSFKVIMVARMTPVKDYKTFINAARLLTEQVKRKKWNFVAIGEGSMRKELIKESHDLIKRGNLKFPKPVSEVMPLLDQSDVGVLMTSQGIAEGCSNAIMEYMACGLPVICSKGGGNEELVIDGKTGFIVPVGDIQALAEKINYLYENKELRRKMGEAGLKRLQKHFSVEKMVAETNKIYNEAIRRLRK